MDNWEGPVYKVIAKSELGSEHGKTSGIVPAKITSDFFGEPILYKKSHKIKTIIIEFLCENNSATIKTNVMYYKSKTHEHIHITGGGFMPTYKKCGAKEGDVLIFWKSISDKSFYRAMLIKKDSSDWHKIKGFIKERGGVLGKNIILWPGSSDSEQEQEYYQQQDPVDNELNDLDFPALKRPKIINERKSLRLPTSKPKGDYVLKKNKYKCQFNKSHKTFTSKSGNPYMEKHHLIPVSFFKEFENSLDDINNILCLCPLCHRILHFGEKKLASPILEKFWGIKKSALEKSRLIITKERLIEMYFS